jgi:signal peptidase I
VAEPPASSNPPPRRLDDPDWVDDIVASAMSRVAHQRGRRPEPPGKARRVSTPETDAPAAAPRVDADAPESTDRPGNGSDARPRELPSSLAAPTGAPSRRVHKSPSRSSGEQPRLAQAVSQARGSEAHIESLPPPPASVAASPAGPAGETAGAPGDDADQAAVGVVVEDPPPPELDPAEQPPSYRGLIEWGVVIFGAFLVAVLIKTFVFQAFYIPSTSMTPTLHVDDRVLVNKLSDDLDGIHRGDIVVFERPDDDDGVGVDDLIKRVIGMPGDTVEVRDSTVFIDGEELDEPYLPDGLTYGDMAPVVVPDGEIFVMGDNRPDSRDSRVFGPISQQDIVGRAFFRIWPFSRLGFL